MDEKTFMDEKTLYLALTSLERKTPLLRPTPNANQARSLNAHYTSINLTKKPITRQTKTV
jgi:hypothetical protein